jgi:hypothetical protein
MAAALDGGEWSSARPNRTLPRERPGTTVQEAGWAPGPVWTGAENLTPPELIYVCGRVNCIVYLATGT